MAEVIPLIEYQEERQRTPEEAVDFLKDAIKSGGIGRLICIYVNPEDTSIGWISASEERDYKKSLVLWDVEQWKKFFIEEG